MVHADSYLFLSRHGIYYFRVLVPEGIREDLYRREYRRSLQTRSLHVARSLARALRVCFESYLAGIAAYMISWDELKKLLDKELERILSAEQNKLSRSGPFPVEAGNIWKHDTIPNYQKAIQTITDLRSVPISGLHPEESLPHFAENLADNILQKSNIRLDKSSDLYMLFCEATVRMYLEFTQQRIQLNDDALLFQVNQPQFTPTPPLLSIGFEN